MPRLEPPHPLLVQHMCPRPLKRQTATAIGALNFHSDHKPRFKHVLGLIGVLPCSRTEAGLPARDEGVCGDLTAEKAAAAPCQFGENSLEGGGRICRRGLSEGVRGDSRLDDAVETVRARADGVEGMFSVSGSPA